MNRVTRLSLISVMLLATIALGILAWNATHPPVQEVKKEEPKVEQPTPAKPKPNPRYVKLQADLAAHENHCLLMAKQATILNPPQNQNQNQAHKQQVDECQYLVKVEREYVEKVPKELPQ